MFRSTLGLPLAALLLLAGCDAAGVSGDLASAPAAEASTRLTISGPAAVQLGCSATFSLYDSLPSSSTASWGVIGPHRHSATVSGPGRWGTLTVTATELGAASGFVKHYTVPAAGENYGFQVVPRTSPQCPIEAVDW